MLFFTVDLLLSIYLKTDRDEKESKQFFLLGIYVLDLFMYYFCFYNLYNYSV